MNRPEAVKEMCRRVGLHPWYGTKLLTNALVLGLRNNTAVDMVVIAQGIKYLSDNRQHLVPPP